jgi:hypothetical protein
VTPSETDPVEAMAKRLVAAVHRAESKDPTAMEGLSGEVASRLLHRYEVEGSGSFPTDMLRYDRAFLLADDRDAPRKRTVSVAGVTKPTVARWNSFGWRVVPR